MFSGYIHVDAVVSKEVQSILSPFLVSISRHCPDCEVFEVVEVPDTVMDHINENFCLMNKGMSWGYNA